MVWRAASLSTTGGRSWLARFPTALIKLPLRCRPPPDAHLMYVTAVCRDPLAECQAFQACA